MKKALIFGSLFGLIFGLIEMGTLASNMSELYVFTGLISLIAYIICLIFVLRQQGTDSYGGRFLNGFVFSLMIGVVYGLVAGTAGFIFAENVAQLAQDDVEIFRELGLDETFLAEVEQGIEPRPAYNLIMEFIGSLVFNTIFGAMFSSVFASFIKPSQDKKVDESK